MSDEKNLSDDLNDMLGDAKEGAKKVASEAKESASEFAESAKETFDSVTTSDNKKVLAGVLAILLGAFGVHKFILGYNKEGGILLGIFIIGMILSCVGIGLLLIWIPGTIGLIEGIIYLTKSDEEFYNTYQAGKKPWF